jgi:hypothetical protein
VGVAAGKRGFPNFPLAEAWNGTSWSLQKTPSPAGSSTTVLSGVACAAAGPCDAVGYYFSADGIELPLAETRS